MLGGTAGRRHRLAGPMRCWSWPRLAASDRNELVEGLAHDLVEDLVCYVVRLG